MRCLLDSRLGIDLDRGQLLWRVGPGMGQDQLAHTLRLNTGFNVCHDKPSVL